MSKPYDQHEAPPGADIEANKLEEPEGERMRAELEAWLAKNKIVAISLDTEHHIVSIDYAPVLPPRIKSVLTKWGSIYIEDSEDGQSPLEWIGMRETNRS
jgi:hypothetical protein